MNNNNNILKKNSRFGILAVDTSISKVMKKSKSKSKIDDLKKEEKIMKTDTNNSFKKSSHNSRIESNSLNNKYIEEKEKISRSLSIENFPALATISDNMHPVVVTNNASFLEKLNTANTEDNYDTNYEEIQPGWVNITKDHLTNKPKMRYKRSLYKPLKRVKEETEMAYDVLYALCNLYEKRTNEYIEMYGYDIWEKNFRYHNYDYDWVDKLDEQYELEMEKLYDNEEDEYYISEQDGYY